MTKLVRVENADTSPYELVLEIWDKNYLEEQPDILVKTVELNAPGDIAQEYIHSSRYLKIREK